jgi:hypothetical protein
VWHDAQQRALLASAEVLTRDPIHTHEHRQAELVTRHAGRVGGPEAQLAHLLAASELDQVTHRQLVTVPVTTCRKMHRRKADRNAINGLLGMLQENALLRFDVRVAYCCSTRASSRLRCASIGSATCRGRYLYETGCGRGLSVRPGATERSPAPR